MFVNDIVATQKAATLTETHPALPKAALLRLRAEAGATDRANSLLGNFTINHSQTKELGGGWRHLVRLNLRAQGDIPGAFAYLVIGNHDSVAGEARAVEASMALLYALLQLSGRFSVTPTGGADVNSDGVLLSMNDNSEEIQPASVGIEAGVAEMQHAILPRLLGRES